MLFRKYVRTIPGKVWEQEILEFVYIIESSPMAKIVFLCIYCPECGYRGVARSCGGQGMVSKKRVQLI